jgi:hypothetical protein
MSRIAKGLTARCSKRALARIAKGGGQRNSRISDMIDAAIFFDIPWRFEVIFKADLKEQLELDRRAELSARRSRSISDSARSLKQSGAMSRRHTYTPQTYEA